MGHSIIPEGYKSSLNAYQTQLAIEFIKKQFQRELSSALCLRRVSAPLFVASDSGLNDNLNGVERPVTFDIPGVGRDAEVVHSLAKWKRLALKRYGFDIGEGLYTDMNAIRRDETPDNFHSIYVDQWDWEKIITERSRTLTYLQNTVSLIVSAICATHNRLMVNFPQLKTELSEHVTFITSQELEDKYPDLTPSQRENAIVKECKTVFIEQIGGKLRSGNKHDNRAPDYDDWALNGDLFFWHQPLQRAMEISSMGIRVNPESLARQLTLAGCENRRELPFHKMLLQNELPLTIGGGIGQSRLCMLMMGCAHIGEVQAGIWDEDTRALCEKAGVMLL